VNNPRFLPQRDLCLRQAMAWSLHPEPRRQLRPDHHRYGQNSDDQNRADYKRDEDQTFQHAEEGGRYVLQLGQPFRLFYCQDVPRIDRNIATARAIFPKRFALCSRRQAELRGSNQAAPLARVDGLEPQSELTATERQATFLG
jgi:hypothetical protein